MTETDPKLKEDEDLLYSMIEFANSANKVNNFKKSMKQCVQTMIQPRNNNELDLMDLLSLKKLQILVKTKQPISLGVKRKCCIFCFKPIFKKDAEITMNLSSFKFSKYQNKTVKDMTKICSMHLVCFLEKIK